jgi:HTH-type transcriptional regulator/antitoxin HigA
MERRIVKSAKQKTFSTMARNYEGLCRAFLPRPIRDDIDYANTTEVADAMALWRDDFTPDQADYFDLLCSLIEEYDQKHTKWPNVSGLNALKHLLSENGLSPADLSRILGGSRNLGAMILRGERKLTVNHLRILAEKFAVSADLFLD